MIKKLLRVLISSFIVMGLIVLTSINFRLHYSPKIEIIENDTINGDVLKELNGIKYALSNHADIEMQRLYPEGYVFLNAIYGLAWCRFLESVSMSAALYKNGHEEVENAWSKINSSDARATFDSALVLTYGAYYMGWNNYLLGSKLKLEKDSTRDRQEVNQFKTQCDQIAQEISNKTYPASYYDMSWPADVMTCVASLALHDEFFEPKYDTTIKKWIQAVKNNLDKNGLIPHAADPMTGRPTKDARGSSLSLILVFLSEIDNTFGREQFKIYHNTFVENKFALTGVREYPIGVDGNADIDSGPLLFDMGAAATIVGMQTMAVYNENNNSIRIRNAVETFGISTKNENTKQYFFGVIPIADAFIVWGHTAISPKANEQSVSFGIFHTISFFAIAIFSAMLWFLWRETFSKNPE
jgi:hypothetical protein